MNTERWLDVLVAGLFVALVAWDYARRYPLVMLALVAMINVGHWAICWWPW